MNESQKSLSRKYVIYKVLSNLMFIGAIWLYFYRIFITDQQVGIVDGLAFAIGIIAEVPSGALADKFGRDNLVKLGQILAGAGLIIQAIGSSFEYFIIGQSITMIGFSFVSGADDALFYENLNFDPSSANWRKLVTRGSQAALFGSIFAYIVGGLLHNLDPRVPWLFTGLSLIGSVIIIWSIKDSRNKKARQKFFIELKDYLIDIKTGFLHFLSPKLWYYIPFIITVQGLFYAASFGLLRLVLLDRFHFSPFIGSVVIAICSLITIGLLSYTHKNAEKISEKSILSIIGIGAGSALILSLFDLGPWGFFILLTLYAGQHLLEPIISETLNKHAPGEQRATVLSVASFLRILPYIALAPIIGSLNNDGKLEYFLVTWAVLIFLAVIFFIIFKRRDTQILID